MDAAIDVLLPLATPSVTKLLVHKRSGRLRSRTAKWWCAASTRPTPSPCLASFWRCGAVVRGAGRRAARFRLRAAERRGWRSSAPACLRTRAAQAAWAHARQTSKPAHPQSVGKKVARRSHQWLSARLSEEITRRGDWRPHTPGL